jgi:hypothetical protein
VVAPRVSADTQSVHAKRAAISWISAAGAWVILGSIGIGALVARLPDEPDPRYQFDFAYGLRLPVLVVADHSHGVVILLSFFVFVAVLALLGLKICASLRSSPERDAHVVVWAVIALGLLLSFFPVLFEGDVYAYIAYGRLYGVYAVNPYALSHPFTVSGDRILAQCLAFYGNPPPGDAYGPLWTLLAGAVARAGSHLSLFLQVWLFRAIGVLSIGVTTLGVVRILKSAQVHDVSARAGSFAFHPLVLYEAAAAGHNDLLMLAPLVWCFAVIDVYPFLAGLLVGASIAIKYIAIIALPFCVMSIARRSGVVPALATCLIAIAIPVITFFPFWVGPSTLQPLIYQLSGYRPSPAWLVAVFFYVIGKSSTLALGHIPIVAVIAFALVLAAVGVLAVSAVRYGQTRRLDEIFRSTAAVLWASASIHPWYALWLTPALAGPRSWSVYTWWFGVLIFLQYTQDVVRHPESAAADRWLLAILVCMTLIVYIVPVVAARWSLQPRFRGVEELLQKERA